MRGPAVPAVEEAEDPSWHRSYPGPDLCRAPGPQPGGGLDPRPQRHAPDDLFPGRAAPVHEICRNSPLVPSGRPVHGPAARPLHQRDGGDHTGHCPGGVGRKQNNP